MNHTLERGFREIFEKSGSILLLAEPKSGQIVDANPAAISFYGYTRNELLSMTLSRINVLEWEETALERKQAVFPERIFFNFRHRLASGEERDVEIYFSPIDGDGTPLLFCIVHDITGYKQAQQELRSSEAIYRATFQTTSDAICITRSHDGLLIDTSQAFLNMLGFDREEVIGRTSTELNIWASTGERDRVLAGIEPLGNSSSPEVEFRRKSGEIFLARISVTDVEIDGIGYLLTVLTNISAIKSAEEKIRRLAFLTS